MKKLIQLVVLVVAVLAIVQTVHPAFAADILKDGPIVLKGEPGI